MDRDIRRLHHQKGTTNSVGRTVPSPSEGSDGDITIRQVKGAVRLYAKYNNKWYYEILSSGR